MKISAVVILLLGSSVLGQNSLDEIFLKQEDHERIKVASSKLGWEAFDYHEHPFKDMTVREVKNRMGLLSKPENPFLDLVMGSVRTAANTVSNYLPKFGPAKEAAPAHRPLLGAMSSIEYDNFNVNTKWPECQTEMRNQASCGSCWAFAGAGMLEHRFCVKTGTKISLSTQDYVSCNVDNYGCSGGYVSGTIAYLTNYGLVTETCMPYISGNGMNTPCSYGCTDVDEEYKKYYCKGGTSKFIFTADELKKDVYAHGKAMVSMTIYLDFIYYKTGIYKQNMDI
jgi:hypothetical protein